VAPPALVVVTRLAVNSKHLTRRGREAAVAVGVVLHSPRSRSRTIA